MPRRPAPTVEDRTQVGERNPTLPTIIDDHRDAARSLQRYLGRARERLRYRTAWT